MDGVRGVGRGGAQLLLEVHNRSLRRRFPLPLPPSSVPAVFSGLHVEAKDGTPTDDVEAASMTSVGDGLEGWQMGADGENAGAKVDGDDGSDAGNGGRTRGESGGFDRLRGFDAICGGVSLFGPTWQARPCLPYLPQI